jgi:hypothetical protein
MRMAPTNDLGMTIWFLAEANDRLAKATSDSEARLARITVELLENSLHGYVGTLRETTAFMALFFGGRFDESADYDG